MSWGCAREIPARKCSPDLKNRCSDFLRVVRVPTSVSFYGSHKLYLGAIAPRKFFILHRKFMLHYKTHFLFITTFSKRQKNSICEARTASQTFLRQKNGNLGKIQNRTFFWRENLGYLNIRSDILILREKLFHILESAQPRFINAFRRSKRNVTVHPPTTPIFREHITSILLFEIPKPFINRGWAESTI